jgi:hypothetical protein
LFSASGIARITGVSHWYPAKKVLIRTIAFHIRKKYFMDRPQSTT